MSFSEESSRYSWLIACTGLLSVSFGSPVLAQVAAPAVSQPEGALPESLPPVSEVLQLSDRDSVSQPELVSLSKPSVEAIDRLSSLEANHLHRSIEPPNPPSVQRETIISLSRSTELIDQPSPIVSISSPEWVAQAPPASPVVPPPDTRPLPPLPEQPPSTSPPVLEPPVPPTPEAPPSTEARIKVQQIIVEGSTVFSPEKLAEVTQPFVGRELAFEQLLEIRTAVTNLYFREGYATSGAFLPAQDISNGIIRVQVVEGQLERVDLKGLERLQEGYVRSRIGLASKPPLNIKELEAALQLLQLDPLFASVQAELKAGSAPGKSVLVLTLRENALFNSAVTIDNRNSSSVGSLGPSVSLSYGNLTGLGDRVQAELAFTEGSESYSAAYILPISPRDGTLTLSYSTGKSRVVEFPFSIFDIRSNSDNFSVAVREPLYRSPTGEFALGLSFDVRSSQTYLLNDIPFSFSEGPINGYSQVTVLRFSQDWISRTPSQILAARSQFSFGLDALGATINETGPSGRFFSWVGQFQYVQDLGSNIIAITRLAAQLTGDPLLPLEQFSVGGVDTVRGYRPNQRVGDSGLLGSVEIRLPIVTEPDGIGVIQLVPFFDAGTVWNSSTIPVSNPTTLLGTGIGLRWQLDPYLTARLDWGVPINLIPNQGSQLTQSNLYFSLRLQLPPI